MPSEVKVYSKQEALDVLKPSLTEAIRVWMDSECESEAWEKLGCYVGNNLNECMSSAALAVLRGVLDVQEYLKEDGLMKDY